MVECGATPLLAIQCATAVAAELLGIDKQVGTLAPGKQADLLAVEGDATANIAALRSVRLVLQAGRAVQ